MALPRYLYSITKTSREPLVARRKDGGRQAELEEEFELEQSTSSNIPCNKREVFANDTQRPPSGESTEIYSAASQGCTATIRSSVDTIASSDYVFYKNDRERTKWEEAALYVHEGEDNDKFIHHPTGRWSKLAYTIHHHPAFYIPNLITSILLMLLAFTETPSIVEEQLSKMEKMAVNTLWRKIGRKSGIISYYVTDWKWWTLLLSSIPSLLQVSGGLEIFFLSFLAVDILLRLIWLQPLNFVRHKRTVLTTIILIVMFAEAITVLIRQRSHFRITRSLRPIFFIDSFCMWETRRVLRHILLCFKPILDILLLMLFTVVYFSLIGYYIFAKVDPTYFSSLSKTYVSLFITLTTSNNPDVMMEAYSQNSAAPIFFVIYLIITLYFISNVLLAVVYSTFSDRSKNKFRKLFLHKREALRRAYNVLADPDDGINFHDFLLFMQQYKPRIPEWQVMCTFKALHRDPEQQQAGLSCNEFYSFYEMIGFKWKQVTSEGEDIPWYAHFPKGIKTFLKAVDRLVRSKWFNRVMCVIVLANTLFLIVISLDIYNSNERFEQVEKVLPVSYAFVGVYCVEIILRVIGQGPVDYFGKFWNGVDSVVIVVSLVALVLESTGHMYFVAVRPIKLARLLRLKQRYRDSVNTLVGLVPRLVSILILLLVIYYSFAIIGIECFKGKVTKNCCNTSWYGVGQYYTGNISDPNDTNVYYLNNFNNILRSYVTLFILMVVNNWYIIMEGFASQFPSHGLVRVYFMSFYVITLVVLQVVIAFIVEAFMFKIEATERRRHCHKHPNSPRCECLEEREHNKVVEVELQEPDINKLNYEMTYISETQHQNNFSHFIRRLKRSDLDHSQCPLKYHGRRLRTKDDIYLYMYRSDLEIWIGERERELQQKHNGSPPPPPLCIRTWMWVWNAFKKILEYIFE